MLVLVVKAQIWPAIRLGQHDDVVTVFLAAERLHGDDTAVPILAKGKMIWPHLDLRPGRSAIRRSITAGRAVLRLTNRRQEHSERHLKSFTGILQSDAYGCYIRCSRLTTIAIS